MYFTQIWQQARLAYLSCIDSSTEVENSEEISSANQIFDMCADTLKTSFEAFVIDKIQQIKSCAEKKSAEIIADNTNLSKTQIAANVIKLCL